MKIRTDFVTNSSSSSFIAVFARIVNKETAQPFIDKYGYEVLTGEKVLKEVKRSSWWNMFTADWAGVDVAPDKDYIEKNINSEFIFFRDGDEIDESDGYPDYDVDFDDFSSGIIEAVEAINENNGFEDIECQYGAGRDG